MIWLALTGYGWQRLPLTADGCILVAMAALAYPWLFLTADNAFYSEKLPWTDLINCNDHFSLFLLLPKPST
jgi:hypothetical protein